MPKAPQPAFTVIGFALAEDSRLRLTHAFPDCLLFGPGPSERRKAHDLCKPSGRHPGPVTLFVDVPPAPPLVHERASLVFDLTRVKVLGLCATCDAKAYDAILALEFAGALPVDSDVQTYRRAAAAVQRGEIWVSREYLSTLARGQLHKTAGNGLSEREVSILKLMAEDSSNQTIADRLFLSRETIRWHLKSLYTKLGISSREAAKRFAQNTLLHH